MSKMSGFLTLLRPQQYYKNLLIFLGLIFSGRLIESDILNLIILLVLGFLCLSFISSISYIINDWKDIEADRNHPEKKFRPLASGEVSVIEALGIIAVLVVVIIIIVINIQTSISNKFLFILILITLFLTSQCYSFFFKNRAVSSNCGMENIKNLPFCNNCQSCIV